ncbi:hypothetical protein CRG98_030799 [Punica granatum]|uniref:Uncharacterized protein n=1 Tax=Punica granatum TaxID=22663 RepID=A0A2I0IXR6_PUNGR|nr:hypothetical protein CRG98_030799 [Punica granatum]
MPIATFPDLLTRASFLFRFGSSPSLLARASCHLAGSAHPCEFSFPIRKFAEPAPLCLIQSSRVCSPVRVFFSDSEVRRACSLVPHTIFPGLLTRACLFFCFASSSSLFARASCNLTWSAHLCEFTFRLRKFFEPACSCLLQPFRICSPVRVFFSDSEVRRACSLVPHTIFPGLLTRACLFFCFASSSSLFARASCNLTWSAHLCEFTFRLRKFFEPACSCLLQPFRICSPVRVFFSDSEVRRACSLVPHTIFPGLLTRACLFFCFASSSSLFARASCNLTWSAHLCEFTFRLRKFFEPACSCLLQPFRICSPVRVFFSDSEVRRACSLVPHTIFPGLLTRACLFFCFASSSSLFARASCNLAWSAHLCEFTFRLRKLSEPARSCQLQPFQICSPMRVYFSASQVRRVCSLVPLATLPGLLTRASLLFCFPSSPSLLARASCNLAWSAHPCEFTFLLRKFAEPARLCLIQPCRVCTPVRVYFSASEVRRVCSLVPLATLPGLLTHASLLFCIASSPSLFARASCDLAWFANPCEFTFLLRRYAEPARLCLIQPCRVCTPFSAVQVRRACYFVPLAILLDLLTCVSLLFRFARSPSLLASASCNLAGSAHPCEFTFLLRKFAEPARLCLIQSCRVSSPVRVYFSASQVRRACSLVPHTILPGQLTRASLLFCFAGTPSLLASASYNLAGSAHPCEFTFLLRSSPVRVYFSASQVRRACSLVPHTILPGQLTRASLLFCFAGTPSLLASASYNLAGSAHPCEFTFLLPKFAASARLCLLQPCLVCSPVRVSFRLCKFAEPAISCLLQSCWICSLVRVYFSASQDRRAFSLVPLATLPGLLTRASLLFCFANSPSLLACASYNLAGSAHPSPSLFARASCDLAWFANPCEFTFLLRKYAEPARLCLIQPCGVCTPVRVYFSASQVRRVCSLVPLATLPGLLTRASLLFCFASTPSPLACASYNLAGSAHPCEFTFLLPKFAEFARSCLLQPCRVCSPVRVYFSTSQVRRACSLVPHTILPGQLTRASLLFYVASSPSLLACASYNLAGSAHPCVFIFLLRKFAEPASLCLTQSCRVSSPVRVYFSASKVRRACSLVHLATLPGLLTRASLLFCSQIRRDCSLVPLATLPGLLTRASLLFCSQIRRDCSLVPLATLPGLLTRASLLFCFAGTPSLLASASYNLVGSAHPCEFTFLLAKFAESARSCLLQPCLVCSPVRVYFSAVQVRRACYFVPLAILVDLLTCASLLFRFARSPSLLARASCNLAWSAHLLLACASYNLAWSAHPCEFTFLLRKFAELARLCLIKSCRVCSPVRVYFSASQVRRACSLVPHKILPGLLTRASLLFSVASSPSLLACASNNLAGSAHPCEVRRACSLVPHTTLPGLHTRASLLFCFPSSPSLLARASCNLAWSAHLCEFTFRLCKFAEPASSCLLQPCWICSLVRVYFSASQDHQAFSLVPLATLPGLLTRASLLFCFANSPSLLACASYNLAGSAHPCEFTFLLPKFAESARSCLLQPCLVCSPVRVYFSASQVLRACSLMPIATFPDLLTRASFLFRFASSPSLLARASCHLAGSAHPCEFTFLLLKFAETARLCLIQSCRVCSPVRVYFSTSQVRRACSLVPHTILPGLLTCASLLFGFASSPSLLAHAYCNLSGSAHPCEFTFLRRKFAEPARLCLKQSYRIGSPVRVYFSASQVRRVCSLVPLATLPGLLTRASLLFCFAGTPSLLAIASYNLAGSAHPCEFTFLLTKFAESARSCLLQPCLVCSPVRVYFSAVQVRRACYFVPLATLPGLLTRVSLLFCFAGTPSLLAIASYNLAGSAHPCEFTFLLRKFAEPARLCLKQSYRIGSPVRVYFSASQIRRACSLVPHTILRCQLTRASLFFLLRKFAEPARLCLIHSCRVCSPVRVYFSASQVRRVCSLVPLATLPGLLTCASLLFGFASSPSLLAHAYCNLSGSAHPCEFTFPLRKFAEPARSCIWPPCRVCSPVRVYFSARKFAETARLCRIQSCRPHTFLPGLLTRASLLFRFARSPSLLARASCNLAGSAHPCEFTFPLRKIAEPSRSCLLQPCRVCSPVRVYFSASQDRRAFSLVPLATLPGLLTRASLLFCFANSPRLLACSAYNLAGSAHLCEFTFLLRKFAEIARLCLIKSCRVCTPVRVYFSASQIRRACSLVPHKILPGLHTRASLLFCFANSPSLLACAS